ncbi:MAG TPA: hypothetical protein PLF92_05480 [Arenimonas sp.]|nr:hypothetical protein [Arenimonas sp.]HPO25388.1 hypothetical protein [Arenimonas sp.]HPW32343.1 hypothetical protein [Arenimonas sp.]
MFVITQTALPARQKNLRGLSCLASTKAAIPIFFQYKNTHGFALVTSRVVKTREIRHKLSHKDPATLFYLPTGRPATPAIIAFLAMLAILL